MENSKNIEKIVGHTLRLYNAYVRSKISEFHRKEESF